MDAFSLAQSLILIDAPARPDHIAAVFGDVAMAAIEILGLTKIEEEGQ